MNGTSKLSYESDEIQVWAEPGEPIMLRSVTSYGDPVELNTDEARRLAAVLIELADQCDQE